MVKPIVPKIPKKSVPKPELDHSKPIISDKVLYDDKGNPYHTIGLGVIFRNNIATIQALLDSITGIFDQCVFTDTGATDGTREAIEAWAKKNPDELVTINNFTWIDDFAAARNHGFKELKTRWRGFLDTDDILVNGQNLRVIIGKIEKGAPHIDGLFVEYDYDDFERLDTARFCRGDWHFEDAIHERLVAKNDNGTVERFARAKDLHVRHTKRQEDKPATLERNFRIALKEYNNTTDKAYRARLARTIGMKLKSEYKFSEAIPYWKELAENYGHLPEGREAYADLMRAVLQQGDGVKPDIGFVPTKEAQLEALEYAKRAGKSYEALVYHGMGEYEKAIQRQTFGVYEGRQTTHECDLTQYGIAQAVLADSAMKLGYAPEAIERAINFIPVEFRNQDVIGMFVNQIRHNIDRITILVPGTPQPFDEDSTSGMLGGSEEAVVYLSNALAALGRNVRVFTPLPPLRVPGIGPTGVDYQDWKSFNAEDEHGTVVVWRSLQLVDELLDKKQKAFHALKNGERNVKDPNGIAQLFYWAHDQGTGASPEINQLLLGACDGVVVLSKHHMRMLSRGMTNPEKIKWVYLSNGIVKEDMLKHRIPFTEKDPHKVIYASCPTRGLETLLDMWPRVKEAEPEAKLDIYYDWSGLKGANPDKHHRLCLKVEELTPLGVRYLGGVGHSEIYDATARARVMAYAHFENPNVETFMTTSIKTQALKTLFLAVPNGAIPETAPESTFRDSVEEYEAELIRILKTPPSKEEDEILEGIGNRAIERFAWDKVAERFSEVWTRHKLNPKEIVI